MPPISLSHQRTSMLMTWCPPKKVLHKPLRGVLHKCLQSRPALAKAGPGQKHLTIRLFNHGLSWKVLMNPYKWICSLCMLAEAFCVWYALSIQQLLPAEERMVIFTLPILPGLHTQTTWKIISALINTKKAWKKLKRIPLFPCYSSGSHFRQS